MTDADRARLERATKHPMFGEAMGREPQDYAVPVALMAAFYLIVPLIFSAWLVAAVMSTGAPMPEVMFMAAMFLSTALPVIPFLWGVLRTWPLRKLPPRHVFGLITEQLTRGPGRWVRVEPLDGPPVDLRLRLKAYLESTGGAVGPGSVGVALCKGDQMVDWVTIPDVAAEPETSGN